MANDIQGLQRLLGRIAEMATDTRHVERPLKAAGVHMLGSIEKNFQQQGRPKKWSPLRPGTLASRRKGRGRGGPKILIDEGLMKGAVGFKVHTGGVEVGLTKKQARRQHFGYAGTMKMGWDKKAGRPVKSGGPGRGHAFTPPRPFLLVQDEDVRDIGSIFRRHIARR